jgi:hypothetical protein
MSRNLLSDVVACCLIETDFLADVGICCLQPSRKVDEAAG